MLKHDHEFFCFGVLQALHALQEQAEETILLFLARLVTTARLELAVPTSFPVHLALTAI